MRALKPRSQAAAEVTFAARRDPLFSPSSMELLGVGPDGSCFSSLSSEDEIMLAVTCASVLFKIQSRATSTVAASLTSQPEGSGFF